MIKSGLTCSVICRAWLPSRAIATSFLAIAGPANGLDGILIVVHHEDFVGMSRSPS